MQKPAVNRMNIPGWRVHQCEIGDLNFIGEHDLDKVRPGVFQLFLVEFVPPGNTLTINSAIFP